MNRHIRKHGRMAGVSMVEALVALVVISVGMLGIAGLYLASLQAGRSANLRMQAVNLASDMADHVRANARGKTFYKALATDKGEQKDCKTKTCGNEDIAKNDIYVWKHAISEALPANANGQLTFTAGTPNIVEVKVVWREPGSDVDSTYTLAVAI